MYDTDGSFAFISRNVGDDKTPYALQPLAMKSLNSDERGGLVLSSSWWNLSDPPESDHVLALVFPASMRIEAWFGSARSRYSNSVGAVVYISELGSEIEFQASRDTTNGLDGTWETMDVKQWDEAHLEFIEESVAYQPDDTLAAGYIFQSNTSHNQMFQNSDEFGIGWQYVFGPGRRHVKGVRMFLPRKTPGSQGGYNWTTLHLHLYGAPDDDVTEDRLIILDGTTEEPTGDMRWGDVDYQAEPEIRSIKIQNNSSTLTAEAIEVSLVSGYTEGVPPSISSLALSLDGTTWDDTLLLGDLAPGVISDEIFVKLDPAPGTIGLRWARILAEVEDWT